MGDPIPPDDIERASVRQSAKSRQNCAFQLGNAETDWLAMVTLTYRTNPSSYEEVAGHRVRWFDSMRKEWGRFDYAWFLEFTERGVAHYHVFVGSGGDLGDAIRRERTRTVTRKGNPVAILRGDVDASAVHHWRRITSDGSDEWDAFQTGGIVERMRTPDAAGRYAAKEAGKRVQKIAPWPVKQWWNMSREIRPVSRGRVAITVRDYIAAFPDGKMRSKVWEKSLLLPPRANLETLAQF